jgi:hypothetical protein
MLLNIKKYCLFLAMLPVMSLTACSSSDSGGCKTNQECSPPTPYCDLVSGDCVACLADCSSRECGPDPACGTSCGECTGGEVCREGLCICKPQASSGCHQGDVWWFDSCGNPESQPVHRLHAGLRQSGVRAGSGMRGKLWGVYGWEDLPGWKLWLRPAGIGWLPQWRHMVA